MLLRLRKWISGYTKNLQKWRNSKRHTTWVTGGLQDIETHEQLQRTRMMKWCQLFQTYRTYGYELIGVVHHGDKEVQQYHNVDNRVGAKHQHSPKSGEALDPGQLKVVQIDKAEHRPEQCLGRLKQTENRQHILLIKTHLTLQSRRLLICVKITGVAGTIIWKERGGRLEQSENLLIILCFCF